MLRRGLAVLAVVLTVSGAAPAQPGGDPFEKRDPEHKEGERRGDRGGHEDKPLSPEHLAEAMDVLRRVDPEKAAQVQARLEQDPDGVSRELRKQFPRIERFLGLKKWDPGMFDLRVEDLRLHHRSNQVAKALQEARDRDDHAAERAHADELERVVTEHFDVRQRIREREIEHLEKRIAQLREQLEQRDDEKSELIERRTQELASQQKPGEW
jgi:hypothetical protein